MYRILFLWHKLGNGAGRTVGKYGAGKNGGEERSGKNGAGRTVWEERCGKNGGEVRCGKYWMYQKNGCGNQDNFRKFVLKIFWEHEL